MDYLNLSYNSLEGTILKSIDQVASLQDLDLSFNTISNPLPRSIKKLNNLMHLNLSYNNLTRNTPSSRTFKKLNFTLLLGSDALCGIWIQFPLFKLMTKNHHDSKRRIVIMATSVGLNLLSVSCLVLISLIYFHNRKSALLETIPVRLERMIKS